MRKHGVNLTDDEKSRIREYIEGRKLQSIGREKLAAMILADLGIEISGVSAARIRREAFEDLETSNSQKGANIRGKILEHVEIEAPKILQYIQDEIRSLQELAYSKETETADEKERR